MSSLPTGFCEKAMAIALSLVLAAGLVPAASLAYADPADQDPSGVSPAPAQQGAAQEGEAPSGAVSSQDAPHGQQDQQSQQSQEEASEHHLSATVNIAQSGGAGHAQDSAALSNEGEEDLTPGTIAYADLLFNLDAEDKTASLVGWASEAAPAGDIVIPGSVTHGESTYVVTSIGERALAASAIISVIVPASVTTITFDNPDTQDVDEGAFAGCDLLEEVEVSDGNQDFASHDGMLFSHDLKALLYVPTGKEGTAQLPARVSDISALLFADAKGLTSIEANSESLSFASRGSMLYSSNFGLLVVAPAGIGSSVSIAAEANVIGPNAFAGCDDISSIVAAGEVTVVAPSAFSAQVKESAVVSLQGGDGFEARKSAWQEAGFANFHEAAAPGDASAPEQGASGFTYTLLGDYTLEVSWAGEGSTGANLTIPSSATVGGASYPVSAIAAGAFAGRSMESVTIPSSVTRIGAGAFEGAAQLERVSLAEGVSVIGEAAFAGTALESVLLPKSVTAIGARAFANCESLAQIVALGAPSVAEDAIAGCTGLSIYIPYTVAESHPWHPGHISAGNHVLAYGLSAPAQAMELAAGDSADLFEGGTCLTPGQSYLTLSYSASSVSAVVDEDAGTVMVEGKQAGTSEVSVTLHLGPLTIDRAVRTVNVTGQAPVYEDAQNALTGAGVISGEAQLSQDGEVVPLTGAQLLSGSEGEGEGTAKGGAAGEAYAVITGEADNYTLTFTRSDTPIAAGDTFNGQTVVAAYTGFESMSDYGYSGVSWYSYREDITSVVFESKIAPVSTAYWFSGFKNCVSIAGLDFLDTSSVTSMSRMFSSCQSLTALDVSGFNTSSVTSMSYMFSSCKSLPALDVSEFDTSGVTRMDYMFSGLESLTSAGPGDQYELNLSGFNTSNVTNMRYMFGSGTSLTALDLSHFDTSSVTNMGEMFAFCWSLTSAGPGEQYDLNLSGFNTSNVTNMDGMFNGCESLATLDLSRFDTSNVIHMDEMFYWCCSLTSAGPGAQYSLNLSGFDTSNVVDMGGMFNSCTSLATLDLSHFNTSKVSGMNNMFYDCSALATLDITTFNTSSLMYMQDMFRNCSSLTVLDLSSFDTSNVTNMFCALASCSSLTTVYVGDGWKAVANFSNDYSLVEGSKILVGGFGTKYDDAVTSGGWVSKEYLKADEEGSPGLFTKAVKVAWLDADGTELGSSIYHDWRNTEMPVPPEGITTAPGYTFYGWTPEIVPATAYVEYTAIRTANEYEVTLSNGAGAAPEQYEAKLFVTYDAELPSLSALGINADDPDTLPKKEGYVFSGYYYLGADGAWGGTGVNDDVRYYDELGRPCADPNAEGAALTWTIADNVTLHALWVPVLDASVPITPTIIVSEEDSQVIAGWADFASRTAEPMIVQSAKVTHGEAVAEIFQDETQRDGVQLVMKRASYELGRVSLGESEPSVVDLAQGEMKFIIPAGTEDEPAKVEMLFDLEIPEGTVVSEYRTPEMSDATKVEFTLAVAPEGVLDDQSGDPYNPLSHTVSATASAGGTIAPAGDTTVVHGYSRSFTITPDEDEGYYVKRVTLDGVDVTADAADGLYAGGHYIVSNVVADCAVHVEFEQSVYQVDFVLDGGPQPEAQSVAHGGPASEPFVSKAGYSIDGWYTSPTFDEGSKWDFSTPITEGMTLYAQWTLNPAYAVITGSAGDYTLTFMRSATSLAEGDAFNGEEVLAAYTGFESKKYNSLSPRIPWHSYRSDVTSVVFDAKSLECAPIAPIAIDYWFTSFSNCISFDGLASLDTSSVTTMESMFSGCSSLVALDLSSLDTSSVTTMKSMFDGCASLTSLDLSSFDTSAVIDMGGMFRGCSAFTALNISSFDTSSLANMSSMFSGCASLATVELPYVNGLGAYDTDSNIFFMAYMFEDCSSLTTLDLSSFDLPMRRVTYFMFSGCSSLTTIYVSGDHQDWGYYVWDADGYWAGGPRPEGDGREMFSGCYNLKGAVYGPYPESGATVPADYPYDSIHAKVDGGYFTAK